MSITREECENDLRSGGFTQRVVYLGYFPVPHPVHFMTPDMRSVILNHCINSLAALSRSEAPPEPNSVLSLVLGEPKLLNKHVDITISAKNISVVHDDAREKAKNGNLMLRVPMKYTSVIERLEGTDYFAFIAKKLDGNNRRCSVFKTEKLELADHIMQIMEHAMNICNEEQMKEEETASGSTTPVATTPIGPQSTGFPPVFAGPTTPVGPPLAVPTPTRTRQTPLNCNRIRLGPKAQELAQYRWYHGLLSRSEAVQRLQRPGEFLIRESENQKGQVILSGMNDQEHEKHLLLIDHEGKVKTQDRDFTNIAELVSHYMKNDTIIVMANEKQLRLQFPVDRPH